VSPTTASDLEEAVAGRRSAPTTSGGKGLVAGPERMACLFAFAALVNKLAACLGTTSEVEVATEFLAIQGGPELAIG
jgi:hypothetical protein